MTIAEVIRDRTPYKVLYCDFETTVPDANKHAQVWLANTLEFDTKQNQLVHHTSDNIGEWYTRLWSYAKRFKNVVVWFHNIKFDCSYFVPYLLLQGFTVVNSKGEVTKGNKRLYVHSDGSRVFTIVLSYGQSLIQFKDSYKILNSSIKKLGQAYGIDKMGDLTKADYTKIKDPFKSLDEIPQVWIDYIRRDCYIMYLALRDFNAMLNNLSVVKDAVRQLSYSELNGVYRNNLAFNTQKRLAKQYEFTNYFNTIARISWELLCQHVSNIEWSFDGLDEGVGKFKHQKLERASDKYLLTPADLWYEAGKYMGGGMTQFSSLSVNRMKPKHPERSFVIDVNSAYPYWMSQLVPFGDLLDEPPAEGDYIKVLEIDVKQAVLKREYDSFPTWFTARMNRTDSNPSRFRKYIEDERVYFFEREWKALRKMYWIETRSITVRYMKALPLFKDYIEEIYEFKRIYGDKNDSRYNEGYRQCIKILLNSGYGCLAQTKDYDRRFVFRNDNQPELKTIENEDGWHTGFSYCEEDYIITGQEPWEYVHCETNDEQGYTCYNTLPCETFAEGRNKWFAAYITSQERALIMETVIRFGADHTRYTDTDSLLLIDLEPHQVEELKALCDDNELGKWKIECTNIIEYRTIRAKVWMYQYQKDTKTVKVVKCAGVSKSDANTNDDLYDKLISCNEGDELEIIEANLMQQNELGTGITLVPKNKIIKIKGDQ